MPREPKVFLEYILMAIDKIQKYTKNMDYESFLDNELVCDAVIKNILMIGEAAKNIPQEIRQKNSQIEWSKIAGVRDMMIHGYFSVNYRIVWDVVINKIPVL
jgi:uncharacterized protein with HEPN domain